MDNFEELMSFVYCEDCVPECGLCNDCLNGLIDRFCNLCNEMLKLSPRLDRFQELILFDLICRYLDDQDACNLDNKHCTSCVQFKARLVQLMDVLLKFYYSLKPQDRIPGDFKKTLEENMKKSDKFKRGAPLFLKINEFARYFFFFELAFVDYTNYYYRYSQCFIILNLWRDYTENRITKRIASFTEIYEMDEQSLNYLLKKVNRFKYLYKTGV